MPKQPRPHATTIIEWANGAQIQYRKDAGMQWTDCDDPAFVADYFYRVKPAREYPQCIMTASELESVWLGNYPNMGESNGRTLTECRRACADAVLRHALDAGQVVTREEFDKVTAELKEAQHAFLSINGCGYKEAMMPGAIIRVKV